MRRTLGRLLVLIGLALVGVAAFAIVRFDARVRTYLRGGALGGHRIYAAPQALRPGDALDPPALRRRLERIGYVEVAGAPRESGQVRVEARTVTLWQRPGADNPSRPVEITFGRNGVAGVRDLATGEALSRVLLEPELLAVGGRDRSQLEAGAETVPVACRNAVLAAEDRHFFHHPGVDPLAVGRALLANLRAGEPRQGGSTITQQLVKNAFLSPRRTVGRKAREAVLALLLEVHASKEEIFQDYLASVYLGSDDGVPVHGLASGAVVHLGKRIGELDAADCALLAGMIRSPNRLAPRRHPQAARARRDEVLRLMAEAGLLDGRQLASALGSAIQPAPPRMRPVAMLYVADEVSRQLAKLLPPDVVRSPGLIVHTGIDADAQRAAEHVVRRRLDALDPARRRDLEAGLVALDPATGRIRALVGGRDYRTSALDHAIASRRQPGSTFKPFVYLAALDPARTPSPRTVATPLDDSPVAVQVDGGVWRPANYGGEYHGTVPLADALALSMNGATVRLALDVGVDTAAAAAHDLGIEAPLPAVPSLALGTAEVSLLELTSAYAVFAGGGVRHPPVLIERVTSADGDVVWEAAPQERRVLDPALAYLMTYLLSGVVERGTGHAARAAGLRGPAAGKTGTTDDGRDAWFVGWTPDVVAGVWVGPDRGGRGGLTGATAALPAWTEFVRAVRRPQSPSEWSVPPGIVWREVDPTTGLLATDDCEVHRRMPFLAGTEPSQRCEHDRPLPVAVGEQIEDTARETGRKVESLGRRIGGWFRDLFN